MPIGIAYVDGPRLARSMYAAADWVQAGRDEINRLNVFPVPDGDTGTNFSLTLRAVSDALRARGDTSLGETAQVAARAAVLGARGNSGMMLAHFLLGFSESIGNRATATAPDRPIHRRHRTDPRPHHPPRSAGGVGLAGAGGAGHRGAPWSSARWRQEGIQLADIGQRSRSR